MSCTHHRMFKECHICHQTALEEAVRQREEAELTAELKERKEKESMQNTCRTMDFSALVETVNRGMEEMQKTPMFVEYLGYTWKLRELKLVILMYGSRKLSVTLEPVDVHQSSLIVVLVTNGSSFSAQTIS
jgi:hypothetical protein